MNDSLGAMSQLLEWQHLIFVLPFAIGALFLVLSAVRGGHRHGLGHGVGHHVGHGLGHGAGHHGASAAVGRSHAAATSPAHGRSGSTDGGRGTAQLPTGLPLTLILFGIGRAPLPMVIEFFLICWGVLGFWALEYLVRSPRPSLLQMVPVLSIAFVGGWLGSRGAAELVGRLMPQEESTVISGDALYGLTGKVAFTVSEKSGRVHIYDEFGTLHDEMCRVADGQPLINRNSIVRVVDRDLKSGRLIVEPVTPSA